MTIEYLSIRSQKNDQLMKILEPLFFGYLIYTFLALPFNIYIPNLAGAWLLALCIISFLIINWRESGTIYIWLAIATSGIHLFIQYFVHNTPISANYNQPFLFWFEMVVATYTLAHRPGFINRLVFVMFFLALIVQGFVAYNVSSDYTRVIFNSGTELDNSNTYGAWLGFCSLVFWLGGWKKVGLVRIFQWGCALFALLLAMQTVSRGALLGLGIGWVCGLRSIPRKYWFTVVFGLMALFFVLYQFSFFFTSVQYYQARLNEDTGRWWAWITSLELIKASPWLGYGPTIFGGGKSTILSITPHNPFLLLWVDSGILPMVTFAVLWLVAFFRSVRFGSNNPLELDALPLIIFTFVYMFLGNIGFMEVFVVSSLAFCYAKAELSPSLSKRAGIPRAIQQVPFMAE